MTYSELVKARADETDMQRYLADGGQVAVTIRIPANLRDAGKEAAELRGISFSALVRIGLIQQLTKKE